MAHQYIAIMAGGIGSRFWPASTEEQPKQFLDILGTGKSLIRLTFERCIQVTSLSNILVMTNIKYKHLVKEHLPELNEDQILCEPTLNNTAPCIAYAALHTQAMDPEAVLAILPSDQLILNEEKFTTILKQAFEFAESGEHIVTLGIRPTRPETGYGYIEVSCDCQDPELLHPSDPSIGICKVASFREKPNEETALEYMNNGRYLWNAGMFVWKIDTILNAFRKYATDILNILETEPGRFGTVEEAGYLCRVYPFTRKVSIDYAILENAGNVFTIPADIGWSDLGTWGSLYTQLIKNGQGNVVLGNKVMLENTKHSLVRISNDKIAVIKGLDDYIVVDEDHALLIYPKSDEQEIKEVVKKLKDL